MKFVEKLLRIPHLDLGFQFLVDPLVRELRNVQASHQFVPYETQYADADKDFYRESWSGLSIVGATEDATQGMTENTGTVDPPAYVTTDIAHLCYNMLNAVEYVIASYRTTRVRIMEIPGGRSLGWHSHTKDHGQAPALLTIQIPLVMPDGFEYSVTTGDNIKNRIPPEIHDDSLEHRARYEPGRAYIFNSFEHHNVFNPTDEPRYTIMFYGNVFTDSWFRDTVESAVERYDGPLLPVHT